jgi:hypothetical protein
MINTHTKMLKLFNIYFNIKPIVNYKNILSLKNFNDFLMI